MREINKKCIFYTLILIIFFFHLINNFIILKQDNVPLFFDEGGFYNLSVVYYRYLFSSIKISNIFQHFHNISQFYPPLAFIERMPFYAIWGVSQDVSILANSLFLFVLLYFVFLTGKYVSDAKTGLLAAFLISFYPAIYGFSRTNFVTIPMAASVALSLYLLLRTENFSNRKFSILFGVSMGLSLLIKWLFLIYIFPPILVCIFWSFRKRKEGIFRIALINLLLAIGTGIVIALPWYLPNIKNLLPMLFTASYDNPNWNSFKTYFRNNPFRLGLFKQIILLEQFQLYTPYTILFVYFIFRNIILKKDRIKWMLLMSLFIPYLIFSLAIVEYYSGELCPRYIIPLLILAAVITAKGVMEIEKNITRRIMVISIVLFGIAQFYWTWISYSAVDKNVYAIENYHRRTTRGLLSPKSVAWKIDEIINTIRENRISNHFNILIIPHTPLTSALAYKLELNNAGKLIFPLNATFVEGVYRPVPLEQYKDLLDQADFVLTQSGGELTYEDSPWLNDSINTILGQFGSLTNEFNLLKEFNIEIDKEDVRFLVYGRKNKEVNISGVSEPEGEGILIYAVDFSEGNLVYNSNFGLLIDGGISPAYATYEITLPYNGKYELWVRYAQMPDETRRIRLVDIYFDNVLIKSEALTRITKGWSYIDSQWFKQLDIETKEGKHTLKFVARKTPFPHLGSIKFVYKQKQR